MRPENTGGHQQNRNLKFLLGLKFSLVILHRLKDKKIHTRKLVVINTRL